MTDRHRHEWDVHAHARACRCGALQVRSRAGRWRNVTDDERRLLAFLMAALFVRRFVDLLFGEKVAA